MTTGDTILPSKLTIKGEGDNTYTLTTSSVTASSATTFSITLNAADQLVVEGLLNKTGTKSNSGSTTFNLAADSGWNSTASSAPADATNALTVNAVSSPDVSTADYDASTGVLTVTGSGLVATSGSSNDITVANLTLKGQAAGTYTLTSSDVDATSTTSFSVTLNAADQVAVNGLLNQNGGSSLDSTTFNIAAATGWDSSLASADLTSNTVTVTNVTSPAISSSAYDASTGILTVTGTRLVGTPGSTNDITASNLTITGQGGDTYTLTTSDVEVTSATSFAITLSAADKIAVNGLLNKTGSKAIDSTTFNLSAASGWNSALASADASNSITVSNVTGPVISSGTYNANTGTFVVTGTNFVGKVGATNDVTVGNLTLKGEAGNTYTLTSSNVELDSATQFTVTLNALDKRFINGLLNKTGTKAVDSTTYNISAANSWDTALASADTTNGVTASNIQTPTITSSTYNTVTGVLSVTGTNLVATVGSNNDIAVSALTFKGLGGGTYTLTSNDVDITDATSFSVTLNSTDIAGMAAILDKNGTKSSDNVTYNLEAADDWNTDIADTDTSDTTNGITVTTPGPAVTKVVQTSGNGYYKAGDTVTMAVYFDQNVTVDTGSGTPRLLLETGSTDQYATYTSGSGSKILTFSYTVQDGDESSDLQYFDTSALGLNSGTMKATSDSAVDATLTLPGLASGNSLGELSAVVIDTTAPNDCAPDLDASSDSGTSDTDDITSDTTPTFIGVAEANTTINLYDSDGSTLLGTTTADGSGNWSITSTTLSEGGHTIKTTVTDAAGNVSGVASQLVTIDTTAPSAPTGLDLGAASDSGYKNNDNITNKITPTINLSAEASISVSLYDTDGSTVLKTGDTNGTGKWSYAISALAEGLHSLTAKATDLAGNVSSASSKLDVTIDLTAPVGKPGTPVMDSSSDTGSSNSDGITSNDSPTLSGSDVEASGYVEVYDGPDPTPIATFSVDSSGKWTDSLSGLSEGTHVLTIKQYDVAGNQNATASDSLTIVVDYTSPSDPGAPDLTSGSDTGSSSTDNLTSTTTPTFSGTAEANATIALYDTDGSTSLGTATADGSVKWSITASKMTEGAHTVKVKALDLAGNESSLSTALTVTIDTTAPTTLVDTLKFSNDTGSSSTDFVTKTAAQTISGTTSANIASDEAVEVSLDNGSTWAPATTSVGSKAWSLSGQTLASSNTLKVRVVDTAGNAGTAASQAYVLDQSAPSASTITLDSASDTGTSNSDGKTKATTPVINGVSEANALITLYDTNGTTVLGTTTADGSGKWSITSTTLSEATHTLTVKATDVAGNVGTVSTDLTVIVDSTAPTANAPDLDTASDSGRSDSDDITFNTTPGFSGTAEVGSTVTLYDAGNNSLGSVTADGSGKWAITSSKLVEGKQDITVKVTDEAGNVSSASSALAVTIDTTAPTTPSAPTLATASDTGTSNSDGITTNNTLDFSGTTEGLAIVNLFHSGGKSLIGTTTADPDGKWSITSSSLTAGTYSTIVQATDVAGNVSSSSGGRSVTIDNTAPALKSAITISDTEPPRFLRRLFSLRGLSHDEGKQVFTRGPRTRCSHGAGTQRAVPIAVGCH